jgi:DNA/RNA endonuclease YhcR with UshA esterase domain
MKPTPRHLLLVTLVGILSTLPHSFASEKSKLPVISATDKKSLAAKIGKEVSVEGVVQSVGKGKNDGIRFLQFSDKAGTGFVAAIFPAAYKKVGPIKDYSGKNVRVTGVLEKYKKQTQIKVLKGSQIKVLAAPAKKKK